MLKLSANSDTRSHWERMQEAVSTKALSGKSADELEQILMANPDYSHVTRLGDAFTATSPYGVLLIWYDDRMDTWTAQPIQITGPVHCLQANGDFAP